MKHIYHIKKICFSLNPFQRFAIITVILSILLCIYISDWVFDPDYYHFQQIRWNELYPVIPGLGNLEDRFAFNSNYLLISSIFTFRFIFGEIEAVYLLQSLLLLLMLCRLFYLFFSSDYDIRYMVLILLFAVLFYVYRFMFSTSDTDILPILFIFHFLSKTVLDIGWLKEKPFLVILLPSILVTYKLSVVFFAFLSLFSIVYLFREKKSRELIFIFTCITCAISLWLVRNVIISGYLIYPMTNIDLFSFDWKMPAVVGKIQNLFIHDFAKHIFLRDMGYVQSFFLLPAKEKYIFFLIQFIPFILVLFSPVVIIFKTYKKEIDPRHIMLYLFTIACIIMNIILAPDLRFSYGYLLGCAFFTIVLCIPAGKKIYVNRNFITFIMIFCFTIIACDKFIYYSARIGMKYEEVTDFLTFYHHKPDKRPVTLNEYDMGRFTLYLAQPDDQGIRTSWNLPATFDTGIPFDDFKNDLSIFKIQSYKTIEARGDKLDDGFRTKKEYLELFEMNKEKYIDLYQNRLKK